ncbi:hypothetical protein IFR05_012878 [Cadophora sp. M221]|nr:hypothetical protein IFR05_012878 [Cadophora sp. M221]
MLCSYCEELTIEKLIELYKRFAADILYSMKCFPDEFYTHRTSFQSLSESAGDGCEICQAFMDAITSDRRCMAEIVRRVGNGMDTTVKIHIELNNKDSETPLQVFDRLLVKIGWDEDCISNFGSLPENRIVRLSLTRPQTSKLDPSKLDELRVGEPFKGYGLNSPQLHGLSRQWLITCITKHPDEYCPPFQAYPLPTRLVDIGSVDGIECPKLILSTGECGLYTALSHCWGGETPLRTTMASIEQYCLGLPINIIPKTFLDAMTITRELGFRYLWIDSLCIIQDSKLDWEQESAVMDDVYRNATVTIAAAASQDSKAGIFDAQEEKPKYYAPLKLNLGCLPIDCVYITSFTGDETIEDAISDKLPAMAGTARALHNITGDVYMAGIWRGDWARGVLWITRSRPQMVQTRAPSWSWARWDGGLSFQMIDLQTIDDEFSAQLTHYHIDVRGKNPFGEVASGSLHLKAWAKTTKVKRMKKLGYLYLDEYGDKSNHVDMETAIESMTQTKFTAVLIGRFQGYSSENGTPKEYVISGMLILKPIHSHGSASFERVGMVFHVGAIHVHGDLDMTGWTLQELTII